MSSDDSILAKVFFFLSVLRPVVLMCIIISMFQLIYDCGPKGSSGMMLMLTLIATLSMTANLASLFLMIWQRHTHVVWVPLIYAFTVLVSYICWT